MFKVASNVCRCLFCYAIMLQLIFQIYFYCSMNLAFVSEVDDYSVNKID